MGRHHEVTGQPPQRAPDLNGCRGKVSFESAEMARRVAARRCRNDRPGRAYKCRYCRSWHIGGQDLG